MKTRYLTVAFCAAILCGVFWYTDSQAKVCFATDSDCGAGVSFTEVTGADQNENACKNEGYTTENTCPNDKILYSCPYKSKWKMCCDKSYHYEGCIYPLEDGGKCGSRHKCKCPDEYSLTAEDVNSRNCQPGKYCMLNDGASETIKYSTCTCDRSVYTDETNCKFTQTESGSCTNAAGKTFKKCYCNRSEGQFPHAACTYGPSVGARTCVDSSSGREYYSQCKTAEEACRTYDNDDSDDHDGKGGFQHTNCNYVHNCTTRNQVYFEGKWQYLTSYNCVLGEVCPYPTNPNLYKCAFDKASWCNSHGYTESSSVEVYQGRSCTTVDGFTGTYDVCPANDKSSLYYYRCKLPCEQEVRRAFSKGYLTQDSYMIGDDGQVSGYVRTEAGGAKHLYFISDITLPKESTSISSMRFKHIGNKIDYASVNGMFALGNTGMKYPSGEEMFAGCHDEQANTWKRPTVKFDGVKISKANELLSQNMSDLAIEIYASDTNPDKGGFGEDYWVGSAVWNNVTLQKMVAPDNAKQCTEGKHWYLCSNHDEIIVNGDLWITGTFGYSAKSWWWGTDGQFTDFYTGKNAIISPLAIRILGYKRVIFQNATIDTYSNTLSWDGDNGSVLFYSSKMADASSSVGTFWSNINVGLDNSNIRAKYFRTMLFAGWDINRRFGGVSDISSWAEHADEKLARCRGIYLKNYSTLETTDANWLRSGGKIYVDWGSTLNSKAPIAMESYWRSLICLNYSKITVKDKTFGSYSYKSSVRHNNDGGWLGNDWNYSNAYNYTTNGWDTGIWYYKYDKGNKDGKYPCSTGGKCKGDCNDDFEANWNGDQLCTACYNCEWMGMGY